MKRLLPGKYTDLTVAMALFVLLDIGILGLNHLTSHRIAKDTHAVRLSARQATLIEQINTQLYRLRDNVSAAEDVEPAVLQLTRLYSQFDEVLDAFIYGGELIGAGQEQDALLLEVSYAEDNADLLDEISAQWQPLRALLSPVIYSIYADDIDAAALMRNVDEAIAQIQASDDGLQQGIVAFTRAIESTAERKAARLRAIEIAGIVLALLNFLLIVFYLLRRLKTASMAAEARAATQEILKTVDQGLFLLGRDLVVLPQHSDSIKAMLQHPQPAGHTLLHLLKPMVSENTLAVVRDYIESLFADHVEPELMRDLNPLDNVEVNHSDAEGGFDVRSFAFIFTPVRQQAVLKHLLVTVQDVTEVKRLQARLEKAKSQSAVQLEQLMSMAHIRRDLFLAYFKGIKQGIAAINTELKKPAHLDKQYQRKLESMARALHRMKGETAAIGFTAMEQFIHTLESRVQALREHQHLTGNDFLPITVELNNLDAYLTSLDRLFEHLSQYRQRLHAPESTQLPVPRDSVQAEPPVASEDAMKALLHSLMTRLQRDTGKQVRLDDAGFDVAAVPAQHRPVVQDILIQWLRNAVTHGVETPQQRRASGKVLPATVRVQSRRGANGMTVYLRDDGRGLDVDALRRRIAEGHGETAQSVKNMPLNRVISHLFKPGFSTAGAVDRHAGRGVGLNLVKTLAQRHGLKIGVRFEVGKFTEFSVWLPSAVESQQPGAAPRLRGVAAT